MSFALSLVYTCMQFEACFVLVHAMIMFAGELIEGLNQAECLQIRIVTSLLEKGTCNAIPADKNC